MTAGERTPQPEKQHSAQLQSCEGAPPPPPPLPPPLLLVHGARAYLRVVDKKTDAKSDWARRLKERRHVNVVAVALAAKHARIAWALLAHGTSYRPTKPEVLAA